MLLLIHLNSNFETWNNYWDELQILNKWDSVSNQIQRSRLYVELEVPKIGRRMLLASKFLEHVLKKWSSLFFVMLSVQNIMQEALPILSSKIFSFGLPKAVPTPWPSKHPPLSMYALSWGF